MDFTVDCAGLDTCRRRLRRGHECLCRRPVLDIQPEEQFVGPRTSVPGAGKRAPG